MSDNQITAQSDPQLERIKNGLRLLIDQLAEIGSYMGDSEADAHITRRCADLVAGLVEMPGFPAHVAQTIRDSTAAEANRLRRIIVRRRSVAT
jgi:hypothetical protein